MCKYANLHFNFIASKQFHCQGCEGSPPLNPDIDMTPFCRK